MSPQTSPRLRRLEQDARMIASMFGDSDSVIVEPLGPRPAERYRITYNVPSYWLNKTSNELKVKKQHIVEISLPAGYPREKPYCTTENPIWHPNFGAYKDEDYTFVNPQGNQLFYDVGDITWWVESWTVNCDA